MVTKVRAQIHMEDNWVKDDELEQLLESRQQLKLEIKYLELDQVLKGISEAIWKDTKITKALVQSIRRGHVPSAATIRAVERRFPNLGAELREAEASSGYRKADKEAKAKIASFEDRMPFRCGRFIISSKMVSPRSVEFEINGGSRISIKTADEE